MLKDNIAQNTMCQGSFDYLEDSKSIKKVIEHMKKLLPQFIKSVKAKGIKPEKGLNHLYVRIMDCHDLFQFMHEDLEEPTKGNSPAIDIGIYTRGENSTRFFAIEGKRLDTKIPNYYKRKKEYVVNNGGGGIERFKKNIHAGNLLYAGMLGYVQSDDFNTWEIRVNGYIEEEITKSTIGVAWNSDDLLKLNQINKDYATYNSMHIRKNGKKINLYHIWIDLK